MRAKHPCRFTKTDRPVPFAQLSLELPLDAIPRTVTMHTPKSAISFGDLSFNWPDGTPVLENLNGTLGTGRTGLVGRNGAGKSTLLKLIQGTLKPSSGRIETAGEIGCLPQTLTLGRDTTVSELLGIDTILSALRAIERGHVDEHLFDAVGENWDIESRAGESLAGIGLGSLALHRSVGELSGGEAMLIAISGLRLRRTPITLLDEPTNNLDRPTRAKLAAMVDGWPGALVVVSHDVELLEHMDATTELRAGNLDVFGGPYSAWLASQENEQVAAVQAARAAQQALKVEKRQQQEAETKLARRERTGRNTQKSGGIPKILAGARASRAQGSAGAMRGTMDNKVNAAQAKLDAADARVRTEESIRLVLPDPEVPRSRKIAQIHGESHTVILQGPERIAVVGPNGSGKTSLLEQLMAGTPAVAGRAHGTLLTERVGYLPQRLDNLDDGASALANIAAVAPSMDTGSVRNQLARLLLRGDSVDRPVGTLSGGERFRVSLAKLMLAEPPAQLLVLDEPTNNLDIPSVQQLIQALDSYKGAILVVSHDQDFLGRLGVDSVIELDAGGQLSNGKVPTP